MKGFRSGALMALVLVSALVVVASPAFATPNLTASSGTRNLEPAHRAGAVSPFITPSMNTRSEVTAYSTDSQLSLPSLGSTVRCETSNVSGYVSITHTQLRITSATFSRNCTVVPAGRVDNQPISCDANSIRPWHLHVRDVRAGNSASGTVNLTSSCIVIVTISGTTSTITIDGNQSCRPTGTQTGVVYTWTRAPEMLDVTCTLTEQSTDRLERQFRQRSQQDISSQMTHQEIDH